MAVILKVTIYNVYMQVVICFNWGTISMLYPAFHKYCKTKHDHYLIFVFSWNLYTFVVKPYITYITSHTKVRICFRFVLKNIFTRTTVKYRFLCIFSRSESFLFTAFDCTGSKKFWKAKNGFYKRQHKIYFLQNLIVQDPKYLKENHF